MKNQEKTELTFEKKPQCCITDSQCTNGNGTALSVEWTHSKTQQNNFSGSGREQLIVEIRETNLLLWRRTLLIIKFWSITAGSQTLSARMFHPRNLKEAPDTKPWVVKAVIQSWPNPSKPVLSFLGIIIDLWNNSCACLCACACVQELIGFYTRLPSLWPQRGWGDSC